MVLTRHDFALALDGFAQALGVSDFESLMEASEIVRLEGDIYWYVTQIPDGRWAALDDDVIVEFATDRVAYFETREAAIQYHLDAARSAGIVEE